MRRPDHVIMYRQTASVAEPVIPCSHSQRVCYHLLRGIDAAFAFPLYLKFRQRPDLKWLIGSRELAESEIRGRLRALASHEGTPNRLAIFKVFDPAGSLKLSSNYTARCHLAGAVTTTRTAMVRSSSPPTCKGRQLESMLPRR
jgi:hypothetical protein